MNTAKLAFLTDRAASVGQNLALKLSSGKIPGNAEMDFFAKCMDALTDMAPAHALRLVAADLRTEVQSAKAARAAWLSGRDEALKRAEAAKKAKTQARLAQRPKQMSKKIFAQTVAEIKARRAVYTPPTGTTKQGLSFVVEIPAEWQDAKEIV